MSVEHRFAFAFDPAARTLLSPLGIRPSTCEVIVDDDLLRVRYGRWRLTTPRTNVADVRRTGPFRWWKAIGPRGSFADQGATLGTSTRTGVCICFHEPVVILFGERIRHPALTVTVVEPDELLAVLRPRGGA